MNKFLRNNKMIFKIKVLLYISITMNFMRKIFKKNSRKIFKVMYRKIKIIEIWWKIFFKNILQISLCDLFFNKVKNQLGIFNFSIINSSFLLKSLNLYRISYFKSKTSVLIPIISLNSFKRFTFFLFVIRFYSLRVLQNHK